MSEQIFRTRLLRSAFRITVCFLLVSATVLSAQEASPLREKVQGLLKEMGKGKRVGSVAVSPDGKLLAFTQGGRVQVGQPGSLAQAVRVTSGDGKERCGEGDVAWSPDSQRLAFLSDCGETGEHQGQENIFVATVRGDAGKLAFETTQLTDAHGEVGDIAWSPDGQRIGFLYVEGATRAAGALAAMKPWAGVIGEDGVEIQRVAAVGAKAEKAKPEFLTPGNLHAYEFDWRPDSGGIVYVAANPPGENTWWVAKIYSQETGKDPKVVYASTEDPGPMHGLQVAVPRWSPDGKVIAFIGGLMSDQGSTGGDVWVVPAEGGEPRNLTPGRPTSPVWIDWSDNDHLYVSELYGGNAQLVRLHIQGERTASTVSTSFGSPVYSLPASVGDGRFSMSLSATQDHSMFVFHASSFEHPEEIYAAKPSVTMAPGLEGLMQLSHFNDDLLGPDGPVWGKTVSLHWKNEGFSVQGWLHFPKGYDPAKPETAKKYPLIVIVHGGPSAAAEARWGGGYLSGTTFSALGYFVLEPNPRGSYGQGEAFTAANRKDFGYGDMRDVLAGVDTVLAKYPVDANRVGLTGWSYGGFMTMFGVTQTPRFRAAVAGAGISDWLSYYGENSIDQWMVPFFGASVYKDPAVYAKSSAINFIDKVKTPTLVVVGDRDGECPAPQSFEFWHALRDMQVPTQLVVYPNEGHGFVSAEHRTDVLVRSIEWFAKYMPE